LFPGGVTTLIKKVIALAVLSFVLIITCLNIPDNTKEKKEPEPKDESFYFDITEEYNTEEVDETEDIPVPMEYVEEEGDYSQQKVETSYSEDIDEFNFNIYKGIISDILKIIKTNSSRRSILNNLRNYEISTFEILYTMHNVLSEAEEESKLNILYKIKNDKTFHEFLKLAPDYAESTIIAEIFQKLSFLSEGIDYDTASE
jgi:hypothetical protein